MLRTINSFRFRLWFEVDTHTFIKTVPNRCRNVDRSYTNKKGWIFLKGNRCPDQNLIKVCLCRLQFPRSGPAACDQMIYAALGNFSPQKEIRSCWLSRPSDWSPPPSLASDWSGDSPRPLRREQEEEEEDCAPCRFCLSRLWSVSDTFKVAQAQHSSYDPWLWAVKEHVMALNLPRYLYFRSLNLKCSGWAPPWVRCNR